MKEILIGIWIGIIISGVFILLSSCHRKEHVPKDGGYINENLKPITNSPAIKTNNER